MDAGFPYADLHFARALTFAGRIAEALPRWDAEKDEPGMQHWMAYAYVQAGRRRYGGEDRRVANASLSARHDLYRAWETRIVRSKP